MPMPKETMVTSLPGADDAALPIGSRKSSSFGTSKDWP